MLRASLVLRISSRAATALAIPRTLPLILGLCVLAALPSAARADIYAFTDNNGVVHFTNIRRSGRRWRRVMRTGPGKARAVHARRRHRRIPPVLLARYNAHIRQAASLYKIPEALVRAVISVESAYDPRAVSRAGARGLMQLMPGTARGMGVTRIFDPRQNIFGGTRLLRVLANRFSGDLVLTIAGYHAGAGAVLKYGGIPPYRTTQQYVRMVLRAYQRTRRLLAKRGS